MLLESVSNSKYKHEYEMFKVRIFNGVGKFA